MEGEGRERARAAFRRCSASGLGEVPGSSLPNARSVRQKEGAESLRTDWPRNRLGGGRGRGKRREGGRADEERGTRDACGRDRSMDR